MPLNWGLDGVLYAGPIADFLAAVLSLTMVLRNFKKLDRLAQENLGSPSGGAGAEGD